MVALFLLHVFINNFWLKRPTILQISDNVHNCFVYNGYIFQTDPANGFNYIEEVEREKNSKIYP